MRFFPRGLILLLLATTARPSRAADDAADDAAVRQLMRSYCEAVKSRNVKQVAELYAHPGRLPNASQRLLGDDDPRLMRAQLAWGRAFAQHRAIESSHIVVRVGIEEDRALVRWYYRFYTPDTGRTIDGSMRDVIAEKLDGQWKLAESNWKKHDIFFDIEEALRDYESVRPPTVLQLVIGMQGGQWTPLRAMRWSGEILPAARAQELEGVRFREQLTEHFDDFYDRGHPGFAHVFLQRGTRGWSLVGAVWHPSAAIERELELHQLTEEFVRKARSRAEENFGEPEAHLDLARVLRQQGLYAESAEEFEKASSLRPGSVANTELAWVRQRRNEDPAVRSTELVNLEFRLGIPQDHPTKVIEDYRRKPPNALTATVLGLENSKWGNDPEAQRQYEQAARYVQQRNIPRDLDPEAFAIMFGHLRRRLEAVTIKPRAQLRSDRGFIVRYHQGDRNILPTLAALEQAQEVIYSTFRIAMSGTEICLFENQREFGAYRNLAQGQSTSEYLQAETITNVLSAQGSLYILSQEVITFPHDDTDMIKTIQHEYGHVAVNRYARGRFVPDWINEGIACVTEGGYPKYQERCRRALATNTLIPMRELLALTHRNPPSGWQPGLWTFQGDRALLAYSQANALIEHLIRTQGANRLLALLGELGAGIDPRAAFVRVMGVDEESAFSSWLRELAAK